LHNKDVGRLSCKNLPTAIHFQLASLSNNVFQLGLSYDVFGTLWMNWKDVGEAETQKKKFFSTMA